MKDELNFFEQEADEISFEEFRQWLVDGLIKSELQGVPPKTEEWKRIKKMMDKVATDVVDIAIEEFKKKYEKKEVPVQRESEDITIAEMAKRVETLVNQKVALGVSSRGAKSEDSNSKPFFLTNHEAFEKYLKKAYSDWSYMQQISHLDWADSVCPLERGLDYI